jgi:hypothetical protein
MDIDKLSARGKRKHIIRLCTRARIRAEREALGPVIPTVRAIARLRLEEREALRMLRQVPSVWAFAEAAGYRYIRPQWAADAWGSR